MSPESEGKVVVSEGQEGGKGGKATSARKRGKARESVAPCSLYLPSSNEEGADGCNAWLMAWFSFGSAENEPSQVKS